MNQAEQQHFFETDPFDVGVYSGRREDMATTIGVIGLTQVVQPTQPAPELWRDASRNPIAL